VILSAEKGHFMALARQKVMGCILAVSVTLNLIVLAYSLSPPLGELLRAMTGRGGSPSLDLVTRWDENPSSNDSAALGSVGWSMENLFTDNLPQKAEQLQLMRAR